MPARLTKDQREKLFMADCVFGELADAMVLTDPQLPPDMPPDKKLKLLLDYAQRHQGPDYLPYYPDTIPEVVTLCGSTRFQVAYERENARLTLEGRIVISVGLFGHQTGLDMAGADKVKLDELHLRKIDLSDSIHVVNDRVLLHKECGKPVRFMCGGGPFEETYRCDECKALVKRLGLTDPVPYVGDSTRREIAYAISRGKKVTYMNPPEDNPVTGGVTPQQPRAEA